MLYDRDSAMKIFSGYEAARELFEAGARVAMTQAEAGTPSVRTVQTALKTSESLLPPEVVNAVVAMVRFSASRAAEQEALESAKKAATQLVAFVPELGAPLQKALNDNAPARAGARLALREAADRAVRNARLFEDNLRLWGQLVEIERPRSSTEPIARALQQLSRQFAWAAQEAGRPPAGDPRGLSDADHSAPLTPPSEIYAEVIRAYRQAADAAYRENVLRVQRETDAVPSDSPTDRHSLTTSRLSETLAARQDPTRMPVPKREADYAQRLASEVEGASLSVDAHLAQAWHVHGGGTRADVVQALADAAEKLDQFATTALTAARFHNALLRTHAPSAPPAPAVSRVVRTSRESKPTRG